MKVLKLLRIVIPLAILSLIYYLRETHHIMQFKALHNQSWANGQHNLNQTRKFNSTLETKKEVDLLAEALRKANQTQHYILLWEPPFGVKTPRNVQKDLCGNCVVGYDQSKVNDISTKAIIFHYVEQDYKKMPAKRRNDQLYLWWTTESPKFVDSSRMSKIYDNVFNGTMSHRRDSDVYTPYGTSTDTHRNLYKAGSGNVTKDIEDIVASKRHLALWLVSNCGDRRRNTFVDSLIEAGLKLDRRGHCYPKNGNFPSRDKIKEYKFYFALENSLHCTDYITEKLYDNSYLQNAVPVVWGAVKSDYEAAAPPGSFIYAEDFTAKELTDYLNYLDQNDTAYKEYFQWRLMKEEEMPNYGRTSDFCQLCRITHGINTDNKYNKKLSETAPYIPMFGYPNQPRIVPSLMEWYYNNEPKECLTQA